MALPVGSAIFKPKRKILPIPTKEKFGHLPFFRLFPNHSPKFFSKFYHVGIDKKK